MKCVLRMGFEFCQSSLHNFFRTYYNMLHFLTKNFLRLDFLPSAHFCWPDKNFQRGLKIFMVEMRLRMVE